MSEKFDWSAPPLDPADQRLVEAYVSVGRSLDDIPYTEDFEKLRRLAALEDTNEAKHLLFRRLLRLRKMGRLPRLALVAD